MKHKINKIIISVIIVFILLLVGAVALYFPVIRKKTDRQYNVSINRIKHEIQRYENQYRQPCRSTDEFSNGALADFVTCYTYLGNSMSDDEINKRLSAEDGNVFVYKGRYGYYSVEYLRKKDDNRYVLYVIIAVISFAFAVCMCVLYYIKRTIIQPFDGLVELPYQLAKGNLAMPVIQVKSKLFKKYIWGMDMLRDNIEESNRRQLELIREKKVLLLSLAHDLKTPLSVIKLYSSALKKNLYKTEEKRQQVAEGIEKNVNEIETYISQITTASNEEFIDFQFENGMFYLRELFDYLEDYYTEKMRITMIDFKICRYPDILVFGNIDRTIEVLQNIIENAIKYGDGKKIWIECNEDSEGVCISICNTGCDMAENEMPHMFDSFFRGSNVGKRPGSGLGLYICRKLMLKMEGQCMARLDKDSEDKVIRIDVILHK